MNAKPSKQRGSGLSIIAGFKLLHGTLLLFLAIGALHLLHRDVRQTVEM